MLIKILVVIILLVIVYSLGSGLAYLVKDQGQGNRVVKALTWRISLSLGLFILLILSYALGWISPN